ncbi:IS1634 family transposase [Mycoplasmopsis gallinacea]|uniref:Transposase domain-containing protein n=1 Tax=Mycoplasmopsis gallinacea TaxID=29556 RepID=A0A449A1Y6_9BACT|nr:IS1634 family transposase [Mycoplasmopsis gallinacea]VEU58255.1 transposase domain-containing protein [Mycoplasmopsis gallinacea]VEU58547.1 transposase domain-containing protein [Mycoplasmopsis gallinacea]
MSYSLCKKKQNGKYYLVLAISKGFKKGYGNQIGLGYWEDIKEKYGLSSIEDMKEIAKKVDTSLDKAVAKEEFFKLLKPTSVKTSIQNIGVDLIYKVIKELNLFSALPKSKHKSLEEVLEFFIATRIILPRSYMSQYKNKSDFINDINVKKSSIYNYLDVIFENKNSVLVNLFQKINEFTNRNNKVFHFDNTTVYFESFTREGIRKNGFSKDGKHNEDQVVIAMAVDENGIPIHYKVFPGNTADGKTMLSFVLELQSIYKIKDITIVADRGINNNANLRFLEQKGIKYIFQKRLDTLSIGMKKFILEDKHYVFRDEMFWKEQIVESVWNKNRFNGKYRKWCVFFSPGKKTLDKLKRNNFIDKLNKKTVNGELPLSSLVPEYKKKYMDIDGKTVGKLNWEKIKKKESEDGFYIIETNILDLTPEKANEIYRKQWKVEENFRTLKSSLQVRPVFVHNEQHILAHLLLCFIALVVLKYCLYKLKKYYEINGEIQKVTLDLFVDSLRMMTITKKEVNGKVVQEIINDLDENHKENIKIYKDFIACMS